MNSFYITLPSNVRTNADTNAVSHYRTTLASPIYLSGDYEVALVECSFPRSLTFEPLKLSINLEIIACMSYNDQRFDKLLALNYKPFSRESFESQGQSLTQFFAPHHTPFTQFYHRTVQKYPNPWVQSHAKLWTFRTNDKRLDKLHNNPIDNSYDEIVKIVDDINEALGKYVLNHSQGKTAELELLDNGRVKIHPGWQSNLAKDESHFALYYPLIDEPTASILGLSQLMDSMRDGNIPYTATRKVTVNDRTILQTEKDDVSLVGYQQAALPKPFEYLLYSNLAKHSICGENFFQLLRRIDIPEGNSQQCSIIYTHPYYLPLATNPIIDVLIEYRDDLGQYANFANNTRSCVVLHFRKAIKARVDITNDSDV